MRLFKYFIVLTLLIFAKNSFAQFYAGASANAYAGVGMIPGQWGGMQACPYAQGGGGGGSQIDSLQEQIDKLNDAIEDFQSKQEDLINGSYEHLDDEKLPFKADVAAGLASLVTLRMSKGRANCDTLEGLPSEAKPLADMLQGLDTNSYCDNEGGVKSFKDNRICTVSVIYENNDKPSKNIKYCNGFLDLYFKFSDRISQLESKKDRLQTKLERLQDKQDDAELDAILNDRPIPPEGAQFCAACHGFPEPEAPGMRSIVAAGVMDVLNAGIWYAGTKYVSKNNAKLGWATPPLAMGLPAATATASLFANAYGGGMGSGSWGCAPASGYQWGPNGGYGNPYGNMSPYGACGGAFAGGCGGGGGYGGAPGGFGGPGFGGGFNLGMGGGIFVPGVGPGGMAGPWGGGGMYPNPYGMAGGGFGVGAGIGVGMGGYPGMGMGGYPGMMGGGLFPGAYPGGYGVQGGFGGGPFGGMGGMGGFGGMGPGGYGMNPYGGMGGPFGGIGGGFGLGGGPGMGGFGGPFGGMGGMGGFPGMGGMGGYPGMMGGPYGGMDGPFGGGAMQAQMYQAYYQAQARAMQNQQAVVQQLYGAQAEKFQVEQRIQYLYQQLYSGGAMGGFMGGGIGVGVGIGGSLGGMPPPGGGTPVPSR